MYSLRELAPFILVFVLMLASWVFALVRDVRKERKIKRESILANRRRQQLRDTQENVTNRIFNALQEVCQDAGFKIRKKESPPGFYIEVYVSGVVSETRDHLFGESHLLFILVNFFDKDRPAPIFVRYHPSMAYGWFSARDEEVSKLLSELKFYLRDQELMKELSQT